MSVRAINDRFAALRAVPRLDGFSATQCNDAFSYIATRYAVKYNVEAEVAALRIAESPYFHLA